MRKSFLQKLRNLELEEQVLNGASLAAFICIFFPWIGGECLGGKTVIYNGFGFFTSFIGILIVAIHSFVLLTTLSPLLGGPKLVRKNHKSTLRFFLSIVASILTICAWSVLTKFTFEFSRLQVHFGLYGTLIGSLVSTLYAFLLLQEERKGSVHEIFTHVEDSQEPPVPPEVEEYRQQ